MNAIGIATTALLGVVTLGLGALLLLRKVVVRERDKRVARASQTYLNSIARLLFYEPAPTGPHAGDMLKAWMAGVGGWFPPLTEGLQKGPLWMRSINRQALAAVLWHLSQDVTGETRDRIRVVYEQLGFVRASVKCLRDRRWWRRARACTDLGAMRSRSALYPLVSLLQDAREEVRVEAAQALVEIVGVGEALGIILQNITSISSWLAVRLSRAVRESGLIAIPDLIGALDSPRPSIRLFATRMLEELKDPGAVPPLLDHLDAMAPDQKSLALRALGKTGDVRILPALLRCCDDPDPRVRVAAVMGLGFLGAREAIPALERTLSSDELDVRLAAAEALGNHREEGRRSLERMARQVDPTTRALAEQVLDDLQPMPALYAMTGS